MKKDKAKNVHHAEDAIMRGNCNIQILIEEKIK